MDSEVVSHAALRILVVDDDPVTYRLVSGLLERQGYDVDTASGGEAALELLGKHAYDLVILDVEMPEIDGLEVVKRIRRMSSPASLAPVVGLTAHEQPDERDRCLVAGMDGVISKPVRARELFEAVERRLKFPSMPAADSRAGQQQITSAPVDLKAAAARCGGDLEFVVELLQDFVRDAPRRVGQLREFAEAEAWTDLGRAAHQLKGASGNLSADSLADLARRLEVSAKKRDLAMVKALLTEIGECFSRLSEYVAGETKGAEQRC